MKRLLILALLMLASSAHADDTTRAKELYENGARLYEEGLYEDAIIAFEAAYALSNAHALLYNIANAHERLGRWDKALEVLNRYRALAPAEEREVLERRLRNLEKRLTESQTAPVVVPERVEPTPPPEPAPARPGRTPSAVNFALGGAGALLLVGGASTAAITWAGSQDLRRTGDRDGWERRRTLNNAAFFGAVAGGGLLTTGLLLPGRVDVERTAANEEI